MVLSFTYAGREYRNFNLDDPDTVSELIADGVPVEFIEELKNRPQQPTLNERIDAIEQALIELMMEGGI